MDKTRGDTVGMDKLYPNLLHALRGENGFDPTNPSVQKRMRSLLGEFNDLLSTTYQLDVTELSNNKKISYIKVPWTASDCSFLNTKEWVDNAIQYRDQNTMGHSSRHTALPTTFSVTTKTPSLLPVKRSKFPYVNL